MLRKIRKYIRKLRLKEKASAEAYIRYLRSKGAVIGDDVQIFSVQNTVIDESAPWLLKIGNHVNITEGVIILTHDYSWSVLKTVRSKGIEPGAVLGAQSPVEIGDNVFIGMNSVILRGTKIGDHVVIGAGSVVTGDCPSGGVYAGNPARRIMDIETYYEKRLGKQFEEAKRLAQCYRSRFGHLPPKEVFREYFMLFCNADEADNTPEFRRQINLMGNGEDSRRYMQRTSPMFSDYQSFLSACFDDEVLK